MVFTKKPVPSSVRATARTTHTFPEQLALILQNALDRVKSVSNDVLSVSKKRTVLEETEYEDEESLEGALKQELMLQSMEMLRVCRPRVVLLGWAKHDRVALAKPSVERRVESFEKLVKDVLRLPNHFLDGMKRKKRMLEELPVAPPLKLRQPTAAELAMQQEADQRTQTLECRLDPILTEPKRKSERFMKLPAALLSSLSSPTTLRARTARLTPSYPMILGKKNLVILGSGWSAISLLSSHDAEDCNIPAQLLSVHPRFSPVSLLERSVPAPLFSSEEEVDRLLHMVRAPDFLHDFVLTLLWPAPVIPELADSTKITLVETLPSVLPTLSKQLIDYTESTFKAAKIDVMTRTAVKEFKEKSVVVWTASNTLRQVTRELMAKLPAEQTNRCGVTVDEPLRMNVFGKILLSTRPCSVPTLPFTTNGFSAHFQQKIFTCADRLVQSAERYYLDGEVECSARLLSR
ncbi:uncharacterized protein PHACADRAFT_201713 [Phanerochaete carnosa HHB-10118-sp]|uniref:NADH:ubiquinone reductase (non-electrogenic) n=1 Tax=Phanerochaete carnosa (strain HHB-10118-sp) TaxID=650164 RepID=K5UIU5_PHACS|nr:uncharacterized protein PHACADRAFT_201713 [Phanerochaete carnosa HHB-10118-sp]EKM49451.1 hypothetical protein PHACADRAFT_201713 [Phanerochaete carnosa HHB-10118-sp]